MTRASSPIRDRSRSYFFTPACMDLSPLADPRRAPRALGRCWAGAASASRRGGTGRFRNNRLTTKARRAEREAPTSVLFPWFLGVLGVRVLAFCSEQRLGLAAIGRARHAPHAQASRTRTHAARRLQRGRRPPAD